MIGFNRPTLYVALVALILLGCLFWSYGYMSDQRDAAATAAGEAAECQTLAGQINSSGKSTTSTLRPTALHGQIAAAAAAAGIPSGSLDRIEPGPARQVADGTAMEEPVVVYIREATLQELLTFLHTLALPPSGLRTTRLHLTTPDNAAGGAWAVETTLTYPVTTEK